VWDPGCPRPRRQHARVSVSGESSLACIGTPGRVLTLQQEDLVSLGKLILIMACEFFQVGLHPAGPLDHIARHYSPDVKNLVLFCLSKPNPGKNVDEVIKMIGPRILNELDAMQK
jgi:PAB-dependent poly(A)-specific ribonuclease subunit 3